MSKRRTTTRHQSASEYSASRTEKYSARAAENKARKLNKKLVIFIAAFCVIIVGAIASLAITMNVNHIGYAQSDAKSAQTTFAPSDEDIELLATQGYDAVSLTKKAREFSEKFFELDSVSVQDGSWSKSYESLIDEDLAGDLNTENLITLRATDSWKKMFDNHPYYMTEVVNFDSIKWNITYYKDEPLPYCDLTMTIIRPELDFYSLNSVGLAFAKFQDVYRITFDEDGYVIKVKRISAKLLESGFYTESAYLDSKAAEAYYKELYESGNANTIKAAEEAAAKLEAEAKARQEAIDEAERLAKEKAEADEAARKEAEAAKAEANKNKNEANNNASNSGTNSNTNSGGNTNEPSSGNENSGGSSSSADNGNASSGNENAGGTMSAQSAARNAAE